MGTVFGKNTTSSSITVAGHKVYYIDSTDAEIVEVEKQGDGGSTESDDATGTISGVTLPTAHSYTGATFDSLRYYVKGTLSNTGSVSGDYYGIGVSVTWYYGTITWTDESIGDLTDKIFPNSPNNGYLVTQSVFRIIFITDNSINGYHPLDANDGLTNYGQISDYSYNNGVHSITFWLNEVDWTGGFVYPGRIQFRYLDGVTTFNNLSAFDLVNVSGGSLSKATTTDRYDMYNAWDGDITLHALYGYAEIIRRNAFRYTLSGTPYWYVIDGEHDTWTDDLSAWGYSEVPVGPVFPEVILLAYNSNEWNYPASFNTNPVTFVNGEQAQLYIASSTSFSYESDKVYSVGEYQNPSGTTTGRYGFSVVSVNSKMGCKNISGVPITIQRMSVYRCSDSTATVVTVYDSSNNTYNAFKFTANNTDYYYVLDGTQTDWTDDLAGIGYSLTPNYLKGYINSSKGDSYVSRYSEKNLYDDTGNLIIGDSSKTYTIIGVYTANGGSVSYSNASLYAYENRLKFVWNDSNAYMAYVEYTVS